MPNDFPKIHINESTKFAFFEPSMPEESITNLLDAYYTNTDSPDSEKYPRNTSNLNSIRQGF